MTRRTFFNSLAALVGVIPGLGWVKRIPVEPDCLMIRKTGEAYEAGQSRSAKEIYANIARRGGKDGARAEVDAG
jgi:hypothetical protein